MRKHLSIFLSFAFGMSWHVALVIFLPGCLTESPQLIPGSEITLAVVLLAGAYMWGPAVAHILTRRIPGQGWQNTMLRPKFKTAWKYVLAG